MPEFPPEFLAGLPLVCSLASLTLGLAVAALLGYLWHERQNRSAIEQELKENESRYRAIFETAVDAIIVSDQHGTIREFSKAAERMTGYSAAEVIGRNMRVLLPRNCGRSMNAIPLAICGAPASSKFVGKTGASSLRSCRSPNGGPADTAISPAFCGTSPAKSESNSIAASWRRSSIRRRRWKRSAI